MEKSKWIMTQEWHDLFFLHWPVRPEWIEKQIPAELELDLFNGVAWIGIIGFKAKGTRLRFAPPIPGVRSYLELNVRTYVKYNGRSGVYFFSLDADNLLAVSAASTGDFLPYRLAHMQTTNGEEKTFKSRRIQKDSFLETLGLSYRVMHEPVVRTKLETWLTERYCLWTKPKGRLLRLDIKHSPWNLHYVKGEIHHNSMASFLPINLHKKQPIAHYSPWKKVFFFSPVPEK